MVHNKPHSEESKQKISEKNKWLHRRDNLTDWYKLLIIQEYIIKYRDIKNNNVQPFIDQCWDIRSEYILRDITLQEFRNYIAKQLDKHQ